MIDGNVAIMVYCTYFVQKYFGKFRKRKKEKGMPFSSLNVN